MKQLEFPFMSPVEPDGAELLLLGLMNSFDLAGAYASWLDNHIKYGGVFTYRYPEGDEQIFLDLFSSFV